MNSITKQKTSRVALFTALAVISAVALPQICHAIGGASLGAMLLPMHLPIFLLGLTVGATPAAIAGAISPVISFMISGMPSPALLAFMVIELAVYGTVCGVLKNKKMPAALKVLSAQFAGRAVRAVAILGAFYLLNSTVAPAIIYTSIIEGFFGILIQLVLIPVVLRHEK